MHFTQNTIKKIRREEKKPDENPKKKKKRKRNPHSTYRYFSSSFLFSFPHLHSAFSDFFHSFTPSLIHSTYFKVPTLPTHPPINQSTPVPSSNINIRIKNKIDTYAIATTIPPSPFPLHPHPPSPPFPSFHLRPLKTNFKKENLSIF